MINYMFFIHHLLSLAEKTIDKNNASDPSEKISTINTNRNDHVI